jgi:two-component system sensor histidine kinase PilS (NtrC family)
VQSHTQPIDRSAVRWILLARVILASLFVLGALLLRYSGTDSALTFRLLPIYLYTAAIYASSLLVAWLFERGHPLAALLLPSGITGLDLTLVFGLTFLTGGSNSPFLFLYLFIIIGGSMLRLRRGGLILTAIAMVLLGLTFLAEYHDRLPHVYLVRYQHSSNSELLMTAFYNITAFYVVGILSSYLAERLRTAGERIDRLDFDISMLRNLQNRIVENIASGLLTLDEQGRILIANRQAERILGTPAARLRGASIARVLPGLQLAGDADLRRELAYAGAEGEPRFLGYSVSTIPIEPGRVGSVVVFQDLTRMKQLEGAVKRQEKLAALGSMAAGIAHEIRNPLGSISGSLQLLRQQASIGGDEERQLLDIALREIDRLNGLVSEFLSYARPVPRPAAAVNVRAFVDEVLGGLRNDARFAAVTLRNEAAGDAVVNADPHGLKQALINLVLNALQAGAGEVRVAAAAAGAETVIEVTDNGRGIAPEALAHLFEPFFSTRADGVGLGLAIVYRIVEENRGRIAVESQPGKTVMRLTLPKEAAV